ncbi:hypothetical protein [Klebsiella aerogenes]|uniref:hypothetical protein n=1 Tax=Klebsiella aerogenes TaxID=548 RepID=UPI0020CA7E48|nr:hypothetical protein [Klebsiella aerogenes]
MTKSTITRERLQEIAEDGFLKHGESKELARMALAAMDSEPVEPIWGAKKYPVCRPVPGAKLIVWDETGKFLGYGSAVDTRESGVAIQISNGRRFDSNHDLRWQYALQPVPVVDSEPVGYVSESALFCLSLGQHEVITGKPERNADDERYYDIIPLYRHAQPAPVAPEKAIIGEMPFLGTSEGVYVRGWNDCRAAMLAVAPPAPKSTVK